MRWVVGGGSWGGSRGKGLVGEPRRGRIESNRIESGMERHGTESRTYIVVGLALRRTVGATEGLTVGGLVSRVGARLGAAVGCMVGFSSLRGARQTMPVVAVAGSVPCQ